MTSSPSAVDRLRSHRLVVVTGKGGVGKSAVSAALGRALGEPRRPVLVIEVDPRENVHQLLDVPPSGGALLQVDGGLWLQNLKPRQALDELVRRQLGNNLLSRKVLASEVYDQLAQGAPGLRELAILDYALTRCDHKGREGPGPFAAVVLDAPATGHGVSLLAAPLLVSEVVAKGPVGHKARSMAEFVADREQLAVVIVTQAEEMPVQETLELHEMLRLRLDRPPNLLVVNGLYPPLPPALAGPSATDGKADPALAVWRRRRKVNERELQRLAREWPEPAVELPLLPFERGPQLISALREILDRPPGGERGAEADGD